jgi:regulator of replication initiation timing
MELSNDISVLKDLIIALLSRVEVLESANAALKAENTELRSRLNLNSKNSNKPPSSDGLSKHPGLPKGPAKKSGGQFGHKARRDIHCLKTKQKVATNFQTFKGGQHFARIQSYTSTLRKHSMNVFSNLINVFDGKFIVFQAG